MSRLPSNSVLYIRTEAYISTLAISDFLHWYCWNCPSFAEQLSIKKYLKHPYFSLEETLSVDTYLVSFNIRYSSFPCINRHFYKWYPTKCTNYRYKIVYLKHYACSMFLSVMDHLEGGTTSIKL
jgi:hypothetical protein